jgi:hypothetical protein
MFDDYNTQYPCFNHNKNLHVSHDKFYQGFKMYTRKGPWIKEWVDAILNTLYRSLQQYPRVTIIRVECRFADYMPYFDEGYTSWAFQRFIESFKAKVQHNRAMALKHNGRVSNTVVRYTACIEYEEDGKPHFHVAFFLNGEAYRYEGWSESEENNISKMISSAWCSALGVSLKEGKGLAFFPHNCIYRVTRSRDSYADAVYRLSYMCKIRTKRFGTRLHPFFHSRI